MEPNPRVPDFLRAVTWVECAVVGGAAGLLLTLPKWGGQDVWAWMTPPFNARYVGVIYLGALVPLVIFAVTARWSPGRIVLWMIFVFTHGDQGRDARLRGSLRVGALCHVGVLGACTLFLPVNSAVFLWRLRDLRVPEPLVRMPAAMTALALVLGGYGHRAARDPGGRDALLAVAGRRLPRSHLRRDVPDAGESARSSIRRGGTRRRDPHAGGRR